MADKETTEQLSDPSKEQTVVSFRYVKSQYFRVIDADGAWGGVSPRGNIHISFYNERAALPDSSKFTVSGTGEIVVPERFHASSKIVRELECDVILDLTTAKSLHQW